MADMLYAHDAIRYRRLNVDQERTHIAQALRNAPTTTVNDCIVIVISAKPIEPLQIPQIVKQVP